MIRQIEPEDIDFVYKIENDSKLWKYSLANEPYSRFALTQYISNLQCDIYADRQLRLVIEDDNGRPVGLADINDFEPRHKRASVGIVVIKEAQRQGYATRALSWIIDYAATTVGMKQLYAIVSVNNKASIALFKKMKFEPTVPLKQWLSNGNNYEDAVLMQRFL